MVDALFSDLDVDITRVIGAARSKGSPNLGTITDRPRPTESPLEMAGYRLLRELGRGGMGIVYEARHPSSPKHVALKTVGPDKPDAEASLQREIRVLRSIDHPGVVRFHTAGNCDEGAFYAMDLVRGPQLAILAADPVPRRTPRRILTILRRLASTLAFVHRQGIVHGDLTPSNVLLRAADEPVLIDFGLASLSETASPAKTRETAAHEHRTFGTLAYMAPEQIRGEPVDARADLYAFGCILYETLTGHAPFTGRYRHTVRRQHLEAPRCPPSLLVPRLPALLDDLTMRLLAKVPDERPEDAGVVAAVLGSLGGKGWSEVPNNGWREVGTHFCAREAPRPHEAQRIHAGNVAPLLEEMRRRSPMRRWFA